MRTMSRGGATVELDLFRGINNTCTHVVDGGRPPSESRFHRLLRRQRSHRDIQLGAISKIDPQVLKSVFNNYASNQSHTTTPPATLPLYPTAAPCENDTAPLTIFYNGSVVVFDLPRDKAENILKLAENNGLPSSPACTPAAVPSSLADHVDSVTGAELPIARRKSLQRFLEKRKERLTTVSPYGCSAANNHF